MLRIIKYFSYKVGNDLLSIADYKSLLVIWNEKDAIFFSNFFEFNLLIWLCFLLFYLKNMSEVLFKVDGDAPISEYINFKIL